MARLPDIDPATLDPDQRRAYDAILASPRGRVEGPLRVWVQHPPFATPTQELGAYCRYRTTLEPRLSELAILVTGAWWRAGFEWHVHCPIGVAAGLDPEMMERLRRGEDPGLTRADEQAVYRFCQELLQTRRMSAETYDSTVAAFGVRGTLDLIGIVGYYGIISMTINVFEVDIPGGAPDPFADL